MVFKFVIYSNREQESNKYLIVNILSRLNMDMKSELSFCTTGSVSESLCDEI